MTSSTPDGPQDLDPQDPTDTTAVLPAVAPDEPAAATPTPGVPLTKRAVPTEQPRTTTAPDTVAGTVPDALPDAVVDAAPRRLRVATIVWGLMLTAAGVWIIAWASGARIDAQLALICLLAAGGVALLVGSIVSGARHSRR